ncbi:hypothetical protein Ddye_028147 [Dipteronia dyeriana]|uniref:IBH1-like N-terminal domain-containing protein n=1 Tax=Dipteronia dyeriana TaxID=168575 RepID=A0AAD9WS33_9ROSI|nr:hypothetical protein Ddye_028147 [Dipteronia dyeriana]
MESFIVSNDHVESNCGTSSSSSMEPKRKRRRIESQKDDDGSGSNQNSTVKRWRTEKEQQIYSSKLLQALRHVRSRSQNQTIGTGRDVREAADRVLAVSAKGVTRWSRAILASSLSLRLKRRHRKVKVAAVIGCNRFKKELKTTETMNKNKKNKKLPAVDMKLRVLGRLIPGCRKTSCLNLLEEATDYIAALEMQVRAIAALAEILAAAQSTPADDRLGANLAS